MILNAVIMQDSVVSLVGPYPKRGSHRKKGEKERLDGTSGIDDNIVFLGMYRSPDFSQIVSQMVIFFITEGDDLVYIRMMVV